MNYIKEIYIIEKRKQHKTISNINYNNIYININLKIMNKFQQLNSFPYFYKDNLGLNSNYLQTI